MKSTAALAHNSRMRSCDMERVIATFHDQFLKNYLWYNDNFPNSWNYFGKYGLYIIFAPYDAKNIAASL